MDETKRRSKRKSIDDGCWDCSVCTYKNAPEAFKCDMCDVRKGTSTRKPRLNPQLVAQQVAQQFPPLPKKEKSLHRREKHIDPDGKSEYRDPDTSDISEDISTTEHDLKDEDYVNMVKEEDINDELLEEESFDDIKRDNIKKEPDAVRVSVPALVPKRSPTGVTKTSKKGSSASTSNSGSQEKKHRKTKRTPRLKNIDRSSGTSMEVTVGDLTVIITDYKPKTKGSSNNTSSTSITANSNNKNATNSHHQNLHPHTQGPTAHSETTDQLSPSSQEAGSVVSPGERTEKLIKTDINGHVDGNR